MAAPKEVHIYDFDGTLYRSPLPPNPLESSVWWHLPRSLDGAGQPGFDHRWVLPIVIEARRSINDPRVMAIVLTGRPDHKLMRERIEKMLSAAELHFPIVQLRPVVLQGTMQDYKANFVKGVLKAIPSVEKVVYYDDDAENLTAVSAVASAGKKKFSGFVGPGCL